MAAAWPLENPYREACPRHVLPADADASSLEGEPGWELLSMPDVPIGQDPAGRTGQPGAAQALPTSVVSKFARLLQLQHRGAALVGA